jgi:hypothetical protein
VEILSLALLYKHENEEVMGNISTMGGRKNLPTE